MIVESAGYARNAYERHYIERSTRTYLEGQNDWKWIIGILGHSGFDKSQMRTALWPLKGHGWEARSQALFRWLEQE